MSIFFNVYLFICCPQDKHKKILNMDQFWNLSNAYVKQSKGE